MKTKTQQQKIYNVHKDNLRTVTIWWSNGETLKHQTKGTTPQLQRAFFIGRIVGDRYIQALTIED